MLKKKKAEESSSSQTSIRILRSKRGIVIDDETPETVDQTNDQHQKKPEAFMDIEVSIDLALATTAAQE